MMYLKLILVPISLDRCSVSLNSYLSDLTLAAFFWSRSPIVDKYCRLSLRLRTSSCGLFCDLPNSGILRNLQVTYMIGSLMIIFVQHTSEVNIIWKFYKQKICVFLKCNYCSWFFFFFFFINSRHLTFKK